MTEKCWKQPNDCIPSAAPIICHKAPYYLMTNDRQGNAEDRQGVPGRRKNLNLPRGYCSPIISHSSTSLPHRRFMLIDEPR